MNKRLAELSSNRQRLLEKIESQRMEVATIAQRWEKPLALVDTGVEVLRFLRNHPILASGGAAALLTWRRKGIFSMARKWWRLLRLYSSPFSFIFEFLFSGTRAQSDEHNAREEPRADH